MNFLGTCPVCQHSGISTLFRRTKVPVFQNVVAKDYLSARNVLRGEIELLLCERCGFVFNRAFDSALLIYSSDYDNAQTYSSMFNDYLDRLAHYLIEEKGIKNSRIVEVGCGKGQFLRRLVEKEKLGNVGLGFDPSYSGPLTCLEGRLEFSKSYFDAQSSGVEADVVICRHVIEHVQDPVNLLLGIKQALADSSDARVFFETPCLEWILRHQAFWDIFYEHCSYFNAESLSTLFEAAGFSVKSVEHIFGGQYLWLEAVTEPDRLVNGRDISSILRLAEQFAASDKKMITKLQNRLADMSLGTKIALWGAGAKGVTLANLIDPEGRWLSCLVDINPQKQGKFVPGTGHAIVDYSELGQREVESVFLMNSNYFTEVTDLLERSRLNVHLFDVTDLLGRGSDENYN